MRQVLDLLWPSLGNNPSGRPATLILSDKVDCFDEYLMPKDKAIAATINEILVQDSAGLGLVVDFAKTELETAESNSLTAMETNSGDPTSDTDMVRPDVKEADPHKAAMQGCLRQMISRGGRTPDWLAEGLVQIIAAVDFTKKELAIGRIGDESGPKPDDFTVRLVTAHLLPLEQLFAPRPAVASESRAVWEAQSYAFVHLCIFGEKFKYREALAKLAARLEREPMSEALFRSCFGMSYEQMYGQLRAHTYLGRSSYNEYKPKDRPIYQDLPVPEFREASAGEVGRLRGETLCMAGQTERGIGFMVTSYQAGDRSPELLAALGLAEARAGRAGPAEKFLTAAIKVGSRRADAHVVLAKLKVQAALSQHPGKPLSRAELAPVFALLLAGADLQTQNVDIVETLASAWLASEDPPSREEFSRVMKVSEPFQGRASILYRLACVAVSGAHWREAGELISKGEGLSREARGLELFHKLRREHPELAQAAPAK